MKNSKACRNYFYKGVGMKTIFSFLIILCACELTFAFERYNSPETCEGIVEAYCMRLDHMARADEDFAEYRCDLEDRRRVTQDCLNTPRIQIHASAQVLSGAG